MAFIFLFMRYIMSSYNITTRKKDKGWQVIVSYKTLTGAWKQKSKQGFQTSRQAKDYGQVIIDSLDGQIYIESHELRHITLKELFDMYMQRNADSFATNTIVNYRNSFKKSEALHSSKITDIRPYQIIDVMDNLNSFSAKSETKKILSTLFNYAIKIGIISKSPTVDIPLNNKAPQHSRIRTISDDDIALLINTFEGKNEIHNAVLTKLLAVTGMRLGEALGLTWSDLDTNERSITINKQWARIGLDNACGFAKTKTVNSNRTLYIPSHIIDELHRLNTSDRIFEKIKKHSTYSAAIGRVIKGHSAHDFRHTYATKLLQNGVDIKTVAALLGDTVNTVIKTYIHYTDDMRKKAQNAIDKIFSDNF